jgi:hypothetical protein
MKSGYQWAKLVSGALLTFGFAYVAQAASPEIVVLSYRGDVISGGDALVAAMRDKNQRQPWRAFHTGMNFNSEHRCDHGSP